MILGHYDQNVTLFEQEAWYAPNDADAADPLVVLKKMKPYKGKYNLIDDLIQHHRPLLDAYDYILLPDSDFLWTTVNLTCYVQKANRFALTGPAVVGRHIIP